MQFRQSASRFERIDKLLPSMYVVSALKLLSEPENVPAMINCAHGKDRTGIVSAIVMSLLGKPREAIIADYARSTVNNFRSSIMLSYFVNARIFEIFEYPQVKSVCVLLVN